MRTTILITCMSLLASGAALADETTKRRIATGPEPDVHVINATGDIEVIGANVEEITIDARLSDKVKRLEVKERGDRVTIEVIYENNWGRNSGWGDKGTRLTVRMPERGSLEVDAVSADVEVTDVHGRLVLVSVSGDVSVESESASINARSTSGDVDVSGAGQRGEGDFVSTSGDVVVSGFGGRITASAVSGDLEIEDGAFDDMTLEVISGSIDVRNATTAVTDIDAEAVSGSIDIRLSRDFSGRIDISTLNGSIDNCFGPKPQRTSRYGPGRTLTFDQGDGIGRLDARTVNGSIDLCLD